MLGQDSEFFLIDKTNGKSIPAHKFFPPKDEAFTYDTASFYSAGGFDTNPHYKHLGSGGKLKVYRDGYAVEVNSDPVNCRAWLWEDLRSALEFARKSANLPENIIFSTKPLVPIDLNEMEEWPQDLKILGCSPTLDAYSGTRKVIRVDPQTLPFRTSGAHLHISDIDSITVEPRQWATFIKLCDLFIGLPQTVLFGDELEFERRTLYGQAGEFRKQQWGLEYRVCSSRVLNHVAIYSLFTGILRDLVAYHFFKLADAWNPKIEEPLIKAINTGEGAIELLDDMLKHLNAMGFTRVPLHGVRNGTVDGTKYGNPKYDPLTTDLFLKVRDIIKPFDENALEKPWKLAGKGDYATGAAEGHCGWPEHMGVWFAEHKG